MYSKRVKPLLKINLSQYICNHLLGKEHTHGHRIIVGLVIMIAGLTFSDGLVSVVSSIRFLEFLIRGIGGVIDGVGAVPIIEYVIIHGNKREMQQEIKLVERELAEEEIEERDEKKKEFFAKETVK
jgi:hypothetical protein